MPQKYWRSTKTSYVRGTKSKFVPPPGALPLLLVLLSAAVPWAWAPRPAVIAGIDTPPNVDFGVLFKTTLHAWDPAPNGGISNFVGYGMYFPYFLVGAWLQSLGVSAHNITLGALSLAFALGALGFYLFCRLLGANKLVRALLTLGYTFNFAHTFLAPGSAALFAYAALPWVPVAIVWAARSDRWKQVAIGLGFALASAGLIYIKINPPTYLALFLGGVLLGALALRARALRVPFAAVAAFAVAFFAINLWWIADFVLGVKIDPASVTADLNMQSVSAASTLAQVLLLGGSWAFDPSFDASPYFSYAAWYRNGAIQFLLALAPVAAIATLLVFRAKKAAMWTLTAILILVFLDAGYHAPFGGLFLWMFRHVPEFWLYREPLTKFDGILAVTYLCAFAFVLPQLTNVHHRRVAMGMLAVGTVGFIVGGLPLASGAVVRPALGSAPSFKVVVPDYWRQFGRWANAQGGGRIAMLPQNAHYELLYDWGYLGADVDGMLLRHPFIDITPSAGYTDAGMKNVEMQWYDALARPQEDRRLLRALSDSLNVQYVVVRHDVQPTLLSPVFTPEAQFMPRLRHVGFRKVSEFGKLDVYERSCCVAVREASLQSLQVEYSDAMPVGAWYPQQHANAIYVPSLPATAVVKHAAWVPTANFTFGLRGVRTAAVAGVEIWSSLGALQRASIPASRGIHAFVAAGSLLAPIDQGRVYSWHSDPGSLETRGQIVLANEIHAPIVATAPITTDGQASGGYGLVTVRPLSGACTVVTVNTGADPAHLVDGQQEKRIVFPYQREGTFRTTLGAATTVTANPCDAAGTGAQKLEVREYAIASTSRVNLEALPTQTSTPAESGDVDLLVQRKTTLPQCNCVVSFAVVPLQAPDYVSVTPPAQAGGRMFFGRIDSSGTVYPDDAPPDNNVRLQGAVRAGNLVVGCYCNGGTPRVRLGFGAVELQHVASAPSAVAIVRHDEMSETGSSGTYDALAPSEMLLPQSFSNGWRLWVDGKIVPHRWTVTNQNSWIVPAGRHRYRVSFWLEDLGSLLQRLAAASAVAALILIVVCIFTSLRITRRAAG